MGHTGSSSRKKHSKKKVSSEGYRKKKSRRSKSKKIRHRDDASSSCSDDGSTSLSLDSFSGSEDGYRRKRARSRSRSEVKDGKKRSRRRYSSEDSSDDSSPVKKRKRSKKSKKVKKNKKNKKKKSLKKDGYVSSASSDSGSCSTCKDEDSSSDEMGSRRRSRGRSREKRKGHRDSTKGRIGNRKNRIEAGMSVSPSSSYGSERIENVTLENNPMRLKSVITIANVENEEDDNVKNDELKEEIVYDYDDYPSSKSNDSVELVCRFTSPPDKRSVVKEVDSGSNHGDDKEKEGNVSGNTGSEVDDLESILRQKALENLSRFRGGIKTKPVVPVDDKPKSGHSDVTQLTRETVSTTPVSQPVTPRTRFTWRRDPSAATGKDVKAATYIEPQSSGSQPAELKLQTNRVDNKLVNEKSMVDTTNAGEKSTADVETPSSASKKEGSSKEQQNESSENSQFEKKTMSVMRGGEMVQVSYKVYIPNKAPALARRKLKR